jgi:hypothetical protein
MMLGITSSPRASAQTADELVKLGRAYLVAHELSRAESNFAAAVAADPTHAEARALRATTRLLNLVQQPAAQQFLDRLGLPSIGRNIYRWKALPPVDAEGVPVTPAAGDVRLNEAPAFFRTQVLPVLQACEADLAAINDPSFLLIVTRRETTVAPVSIDRADILMFRALGRFLEYVGYTANSWNSDVALDALRAFALSDQPTVEEFLTEFPNAMTFATTNDLVSARQAFSSAVDRYLESSVLIRARPPNLVRFFNLNLDDYDHEEVFRKTLTEVRASLSGPVLLSVDTNYTVWLGSHFSGLSAPRSWLPVFYGNGILARTVPPPALGGLVQGPALTPGGADEALARRFVLYPWLSSPQRTAGGGFRAQLVGLDGHEYALDASSNLVDWVEVETLFTTNGVAAFFDAQASLAAGQFYQLRDVTGVYLSVAGVVIDACSGLPLAGAALELDGVTTRTDGLGRFRLATRLLPDYWNGHSLVISAPGFLDYNETFYPYELDELSFALHRDNPTAPPNDAFANRIIIGPASLPMVGTTCGASGEPGSRSRSVWYQWTAPYGGTACFGVEETNFFGTDLRIFRGTTLSSLVQLSSGVGYVCVEVEEGTIYQIEVNAFSGYEGVFQIRVGGPPTVTIEQPEDGQVFFSPAQVSVVVRVNDPDRDITRVRISTDDNRVEFPNGSSSYTSTFQLKEPDEYWIEVEAHDSFGFGSWDYRYVIVVPGNDDFARREIIPGNAQVVFGSNRGATAEDGEPEHGGASVAQSVWWTWTAPSDGIMTVRSEGAREFSINAMRLAVYTGASLPALLPVAAGHPDPLYQNASEVTFAAVAGTTYHFAVDSADLCCDRGDAIVLELHRTIPPAIALLAPSPDTVMVAGDNLPVTVDVSDPDGRVIGVEVYLDGEWLMTAVNAPFGLVVPDISAGYHSLIVVAVDNLGVWTAADGVFLTAVPANDNFANRAMLQGARLTASGSNRASSAEPDEPDHAGEVATSSVWWEWTAPLDGTALLSASGESFNPILAVYRGPSFRQLDEVASDVAFDGKEARVGFHAERGVTYFIAVDGYFGAQGDILLALELFQPPSNDQFANRIVLTGTSLTVTGANTAASAELDEPEHVGFPAEASVWWEWTPPFGGVATISTIGSDFETVLAIYLGTAFNNFELVSNDIDSGDDGTSLLEFEAEGGVTYLIAVDGWFGDRGRIRLNIGLVEYPPVIEEQPEDTTVFAGETVEFWVHASGSLPLTYQWKFNGTDIPGSTSELLELPNVTTNQSGLYTVQVRNHVGTVASEPAELKVLTRPTLEQALDSDGLSWITGGAQPWNTQSQVTHDGIDASLSGNINALQTSWLQTTVTGPGTLSFWWKVSSEANYDVLVFQRNGVTQSTLSGEVDWQELSYTIPAGNHTLRWSYSKDGTVTRGLDRGWLDQISFGP